MCLAPFGKKATTLTLTGLTNESVDVSVDIFRTVVLPFLTKHFGVEGVSSPSPLLYHPGFAFVVSG